MPLPSQQMKPWCLTQLGARTKASVPSGGFLPLLHCGCMFWIPLFIILSIKPNVSPTRLTHKGQLIHKTRKGSKIQSLFLSWYFSFYWQAWKYSFKFINEGDGFLVWNSKCEQSLPCQYASFLSKAKSNLNSIINICPV